MAGAFPTWGTSRMELRHGCQVELQVTGRPGVRTSHVLSTDRCSPLLPWPGPQDTATLCPPPPPQLQAASENETAQNPALLGAQHLEGLSGQPLGLSPGCCHPGMCRGHHHGYTDIFSKYIKWDFWNNSNILKYLFKKKIKQIRRNHLLCEC